MLTKTDLLQIESVMNRRVNPFEEKVDDKFEELENKINLLPTKDEFYLKMDEVMGELKAIREEQTAQSGVLSNHSDRIEKLESLHPELPVSA